MSSELEARTGPGRQLVSLAEQLGSQLHRSASAHDRDGSFPFLGFRALKDAGYFTAPVPADLGGLGVGSVHDVLVASSRLARADASLTLGVNMHFAYVLGIVRRRQIAVAGGDERRAAAFGSSLERIVREQTVFAAAGSEPGQDLMRPATTAARTDEGWIVSGRKIFCTMSPAADVFYTAVTFLDDHGDERYGYALVPRRTEGVRVRRDWDALGMRASGSNSVTFQDVRLPPAALRGGFRVGDTIEYIERNLVAGLLHTAISLGIAEAAHERVVRQLRKRGGSLDARAEVLAAENLVDLAACRAVFARAATLIDDHHERSPASLGTAAELTELFAEAQSAKAFAGEATPRVVDRALALSGGDGYLNGSTLARAYRDVRALPFMHPLGANRAYGFLGRHAVGLAPAFN
jgi:alkylation response protein AidB-like acyl-CoA dehydrogenase